MNKLEVLRKCELFKKLDDKQLRVIERMCTPEVFEPGAIIAKQDTKEEKLYIIEEGLVAILLEVGPLAQRQVQAASNFEAVGWSAMLEPHIATATVKAVEKTRVLAFDGITLHDMCFTHPEIGCRVSRGLARVVASRLRNAYAQLLGVASQV